MGTENEAEEEEEEEQAAAGDDASGDAEGEEDDSDFDADALAARAVKAAEASKSRRRELPELSLDVGLGDEHLYLTSSTQSAVPAFDTTAAPRVSRLSSSDFGAGAEAEPPAASSSGAREVRGAPVRPVNDKALRKKERKAEREAKLDKWFGLRRRKLTPELEKELKAIKLRANFDPKRFYKGQDSQELPKYFAIATEVGGGMQAASFHADTREVRANSGRSFLDEIMRDSKAQEWTWKRAGEVSRRANASLKSGHGSANPKARKNAKATHRGLNWRKQKKHGR